MKSNGILLDCNADFNVDFIMDFTVDFIYAFNGFDMKSVWFHVKDQEKVRDLTWISCFYWFLLDFISNLPDFTEIHWISWNLTFFSKMSFWIITKYRCGFHKILRHSLPTAPLQSIKLKSFHWIIWFYSFQVDFTWNPPDFMKSTWDMHEIVFPLQSMKLKSLCWIIWF